MSRILLNDLPAPTPTSKQHLSVDGPWIHSQTLDLIPFFILMILQYFSQLHSQHKVSKFAITVCPM